MLKSLPMLSVRPRGVPITLRGKPVQLSGRLPVLAEAVASFKLINTALRERLLRHYASQRLLISVVPSLDTSVCAASTHRLNHLAAEHPELTVLVVSADLPFAQKRFCEAEGLSHIETLSMMRDRQFAEDYGLLITSGPLAGLAARALLLVDGEGRLEYIDLVSEVTEEPDYEALLRILDKGNEASPARVTG